MDKVKIKTSSSDDVMHEAHWYLTQGYDIHEVCEEESVTPLRLGVINSLEDQGALDGVPSGRTVELSVEHAQCLYYWVDNAVEIKQDHIQYPIDEYGWKTSQQKALKAYRDRIREALGEDAMQVPH